jgi:MFS family permease
MEATVASARMAMSGQEFSDVKTKDESSGAGVSWPAVFAGAFVIGALALILAVLGAGTGLSSVSPWPNEAASASRVSVVAIVWIIAVQLIASSIGGYPAGRLRTKWVSLHTHEVYFRDTAHGFISWCVALVISTALFAAYATSIATRPTSSDTAPGNYFVDMLFRSEHPSTTRTDQPLRGEAALILANSLRHRDMNAQDQAYLTSLVAAATGLTQPEAQQRVSDTVAAAREAADAARKAIAHSLYWLFVAFLIGAFCASYAATIGGRQRDSVPALH